MMVFGKALIRMVPTNPVTAIARRIIDKLPVRRLANTADSLQTDCKDIGTNSASGHHPTTSMKVKREFFALY